MGKTTCDMIKEQNLGALMYDVSMWFTKNPTPIGVAELLIGLGFESFNEEGVGWFARWICEGMDGLLVMDETHKVFPAQ